MITRLVLLVYHVLWREDRARFLGPFLLEAFAIISTTQQVQVDQCLLCHKYLVKCHQLIYKETSFPYSTYMYSTSIKRRLHSSQM